ncbi:phage portal protein [Corynebacterium sp. H127]|uniref:phage portal protein n=1 Tax=Corynebacterium sp. H127 TaxID=3133418 RepID=UPI0030B43024
MVAKDDQATIEKLFRDIQRNKRADKINESYYRGLQDIGNLGISVPPDVQPFAFPLNWCRTYVDVMTERQDVRMILRAGENSEDSDLRQDWAANNLDTEQVKFNRDMAVLGRACLSVASNPDGEIPRIRVESPKNLAVEIDTLTQETTGALRIWRNKTGLAEHMTLYRPDYTLLLSKKRGKWEEKKVVEHGLGRVPVIMQFNRLMSGDEYTGETQMADLKPLVNMAGRVMLQLQLAMETVATPQKVGIGMTKKDFQDENGNLVEDVWETYLGAVWLLSNPKAEVKQLPGAELKGFHDTIKMLAEQASTVTGLPVRMMGQNTANPAAEGSIRADESRLVKQVERLNSQAGVAFAWALGISERLRTREWPDGQIQIVWHNPGTPTEAQRADAINKLSGGKAIYSRRGAMQELGWSQERIDQEISWLEEEEGGLSIDRLGREVTM